MNKEGLPPVKGSSVDSATFRRVWERVMPDQTYSPITVETPEPELPTVPTCPAQPELPTVPTCPAQPELPTVPMCPAQPELPTVPTCPAQPELPTVPTCPAQPTLPTVPTCPAQPELPTVPTCPAQPELPTVPVCPAQPTLPTVPACPAQPELPTVPACPAQPVCPSAPTCPVRPTKPLVPNCPPEAPGGGCPCAEQPPLCLGEASEGEARCLEERIAMAQVGMLTAQAIARRAGGACAKAIANLAADHRQAVRRLSAAHFLITGRRFRPGCSTVSLPATLALALREQFIWEQRWEQCNRQAAQDTKDPCLEALFQELAQEGAFHAGTIRSLLEQMT